MLNMKLRSHNASINNAGRKTLKSCTTVGKNSRRTKRKLARLAVREINGKMWAMHPTRGFTETL